MCNGAAAILNKNPTIVIIKPRLKPFIILSLYETETILYIDSKLVKPVYEYIKPAPNKIKQDDKPPNKKYFNPADVDDSESLYNVDKIYTPKDCNSILKYIEIRSAEETNKDAPKVLNKTIKEYSAALFILALVIYEFSLLNVNWATTEFTFVKLDIEGQAIKIRAPVKKIKGMGWDKAMSQ